MIINHFLGVGHSLVHLPLTTLSKYGTQGLDIPSCYNYQDGKRRHGGQHENHSKEQIY